MFQTLNSISMYIIINSLRIDLINCIFVSLKQISFNNLTALKFYVSIYMINDNPINLLNKTDGKFIIINGVSYLD